MKWQIAGIINFTAIMVTYTTSNNEKDLAEILALQKANLAVNLSAADIQSQGFVTVAHSPEDMANLNRLEQHIVAKDNDRVVGYLLAMTAQSKQDIPVLIPMFEQFDKVIFAGKPLTAYHYIVVGQVCVAKEYRGQGILDDCYSAYRNHFKDKYDFAVTEIDSNNLRSLNAHKRIGFKAIHQFTDANKTNWVIVLWDWNNIEP